MPSKQMKQRKRGMGSIFKHGRSWYIAYYVDGQQVKEKIGTVGLVTKGQAQEALKARMGEIVQGRFSIDKVKKSLTLNKLIEKYVDWIKENNKSYKREKQVAANFLQFIGNKRINHINSWEIEQYKSRRKQEGVKPSTINRELNVLRSIFNRATEWGDLTTSPLKSVKKAKPLKADEYARESVYIPNEIFNQIVKNSPPELQAFILVARNTGMRVSELLKLSWTDVDLNKEQIRVRDTKNYNQRIVPLNSIALKTISELPKEREKLFSYASKDSVGKAWRRVLEKLGVKGYRLHDLRHSFITDLVTNSVDIATVMEITGHKDIRMLKRYTHPSDEHKKKAVDLLSSNDKSIKSSKVIVIK